jgi:putative transposase
VLTIIDTFSRFSPIIDLRCSYRAEDVVQSLERICRSMGSPKTIPVDKGSEFISRDMDLWADAKGVTLDFSRPGKPTYNAFCRSLQRALPGRVPERAVFLTLDDARSKMKD